MAATPTTFLESPYPERIHSVSPIVESWSAGSVASSVPYPTMAGLLTCAEHDDIVLLCNLVHGVGPTKTDLVV